MIIGHPYQRGSVSKDIVMGVSTVFDIDDTTIGEDFTEEYTELTGVTSEVFVVSGDHVNQFSIEGVGREFYLLDGASVYTGSPIMSVTRATYDSGTDETTVEFDVNIYHGDKYSVPNDYDGVRFLIPRAKVVSLTPNVTLTLLFQDNFIKNGFPVVGYPYILLPVANPTFDQYTKWHPIGITNWAPIYDDDALPEFSQANLPVYVGDKITYDGKSYWIIQWKGVTVYDDDTRSIIVSEQYTFPSNIVVGTDKAK
jgi:hypothetical protein